MRALCVLVAVAVLLQLACAQKELAGAYIEGNDWCPEANKQKAGAPQTTTERGGLGRVFSRSDSKKQAAPAPPPACKMPQKLCGSVQAVMQRCKATFGCKAISYDGRCGLLKTADGPRKARPGWSTYVIA